jgi:hypothetical protein
MSVVNLIIDTPLLVGQKRIMFPSIARYIRLVQPNTVIRTALARLFARQLSRQ